MFGIPTSSFADTEFLFGGLTTSQRSLVMGCCIRRLKGLKSEAQSQSSSELGLSTGEASRGRMRLVRTNTLALTCTGLSTYRFIYLSR